jgi:hypothetical protein
LDRADHDSTLRRASIAHMSSRPASCSTKVALRKSNSRLRSQAPWLNFVPTVYYDYFQNRSTSNVNWADLVPTLDSFLYYFRNQKNGICIDDTAECENTVNNAPAEIRDMSSLLPAGRKLQVGIYFVACQACSKHSTAVG